MALGVQSPGRFDCTWLGSGQITSGDTFYRSFNDCWFDDFEDEDELVKGGIDLVGYHEMVDANNRLIRIGFGGLSETISALPKRKELRLALSSQIRGPESISPVDSRSFLPNRHRDG